MSAAEAPDPINIIGGTHTEPGDTELDDAIAQIVGDYITDSIISGEIARRVVGEVAKRTGLDVFARPVTPIPTLNAFFDAYFRPTGDDQMKSVAQTHTLDASTLQELREVVEQTKHLHPESVVRVRTRAAFNSAGGRITRITLEQPDR